MNRILLHAALLLGAPLLLIAQTQGTGGITPSMKALMESSRPAAPMNILSTKRLPDALLAVPFVSSFDNVNVIEEQEDNSPMQNESGIAVNPLNPSLLIASAVDYRAGSSTWVYVSENGGKTWRNVNLGTPPGLNFTSSNDPSVAFDYEGRGYLVYGGFDRGRTLGENGVFISVTEDGGKTWRSHTPVILHKGKMTPDSAFEDKYYISVDNSRTSPYRGHLYIPWKRVYDRDSSTQIVITKSTDHGRTWSVPIRVSDVLTGKSLDTTFGQSFPLISTGENGEVYVVWNYGPLRSIGFNSSTDGGKTWGSPRLIQQYEWLGVTRFTGSQYNHTLKGVTRVETYPSLVVDTTNSPRRGWLYLTWAADKTPNIYFSRSTDKGVTWSAPKIIHSDTTNDQYWQWISLDGTNGDLAVMYSDSRDDATNKLSLCYVSYSSDGGTTWTDRRVSDAGSDITRNPFNGTFAGDYSGCAFHNGIIYPSSVDMRNTENNISDNDVYSGIVNTRAPMPVSDFIAKTIPTRRTTIALSWKAPQFQTFGQPLDASTFVYLLHRNGQRIATLPSSQLTYDDMGLQEYNSYTYTITAATALDTSATRTATAFAGGSKQPGTPVFDAATMEAGTNVEFRLRLPSLRLDSITAFVNMRYVRIYRDSVMTGEFEVLTTDTGKTKLFFDNPNERGYYVYQFSVVDSAGNESPRSSEQVVFAGQVEQRHAEAFDAPMPRYYKRGAWQLTTDVAASQPSSLTSSVQKQYKNNQRDTLMIFPVESLFGLYTVSFSTIGIVDAADTAVVEYSINNSVSWKQLARFTKLMQPEWQDGTIANTDWKPYSYSIGGGNTMTLRFRFRSNLARTDIGWYVDNLDINSVQTSVGDPVQATVMLYPNPATSSFRIVHRDVQRVEVFSMLGEQMLSVQSSERSGDENMLVECGALPQGTYGVRIHTPAGVITQMLHIIR
ncbi:MAG: exo-alpha-sialidase [Candidatus Kapabacteria bacterium]|nr:exo-alpha-sialidase [Candidatus Kapabacteria bacterium]